MKSNVVVISNVFIYHLDIFLNDSEWNHFFHGFFFERRKKRFHDGIVIWVFREHYMIVKYLSFVGAPICRKSNEIISLSPFKMVDFQVQKNT